MHESGPATLRADLIHGECLEEMASLPDQSVDLVLCDLPYGTTRNRWDVVIPFAPLWAAYRRICRGPVVLTAAQPFTSALVSSNLAWFKYDWTWRKLGKPTGHLNAAHQPLRDKEDVLVFYGSRTTYNPQMRPGAPYAGKTGKGRSAATSASVSDNYGAFNDSRKPNDGVRHPRQVLEFPRVSRNRFHPTEKPLALMDFLIRTYTNEGDVVLDNCAGSFTTGVAALRAGRKFIGMEKDPSYFAIGEERIRREVANLEAAALSSYGTTGNSKSDS